MRSNSGNELVGRKRLCTVEGCQRPQMGRGYCERHYDEHPLPDKQQQPVTLPKLKFLDIPYPPEENPLSAWYIPPPKKRSLR